MALAGKAACRLGDLFHGLGAQPHLTGRAAKSGAG